MNKNNLRVARFALCASMSAVLVACGGGGSGSNTDASTGSGNGQSSATANSVSGTVAIGHALAGAPITLTDVNGKTGTATSDANGSYSVSITGLTAPFLITAIDKSGVSGTLYSVVAHAGTAGGAPVTANVTPLTTAVAALITQSGNPGDLGQAGGLAAITSSAINTAVATLDTAIAPILTQYKLSASSFDPIGGAFTPDQTAADGVIDSVAVTPSAKNGGYQITSLADPDTAIQLSASAAVSTPLAAPSQLANYLSALQTELAQCMADMQGGAATSTACNTAIDANYLRYGKTSFGTAHTLYQKGTQLTGIKTMAFLPAGSLPGIANPAALVYLLVTDPDGTPDFGTEVVQQLPDGSWDIIGDQEKFGTYIASFVGRTQYVNSADTGKGHYEAGLDIQIPSTVKTSAGSIFVGSALVTGPGLPAGGLWMQSPWSGVGGLLTIPSGKLSAPATYGQATGGGMATTYKWAWAPLSGSSTTFMPGSLPEYAASSQDVSTIKNYGMYTVTMYGADGAAIATEQVLNVAPNYSAAAGGTVAWQALGSDVIANYLTPGGSGTSVTGNAAANLDWTVPSGAVYPNFWASINSLSAWTAASYSVTYDADFYPSNAGNAPNSITFPARFVDVLTTSGNAAAEQAVQVQLSWQAAGDFYINTWQYNNSY
jgi:glucoamylase